MRIFAIRDESKTNQKDLAYLLYYEKEKHFYIELPEDADPWDTPLLLDSFLKRGEHSVNSYWSKVWVEQRIVPPERQNISKVLLDNGLSEYDEFELLMLADGRCAQDDYYLVPLNDGELPEEMLRRFATLIEDVVALDEFCVIAFFRDGKTKKCNLREHFESHKPLEILLKKPEFFQYMRMQSGGLGVCWDEDKAIPASVLYDMGEEIPLTISDFKAFAKECIINASEAAEILSCSRQNISDLTNRGKLHPVKKSDKSTLFLKSEVLKRNWEA
jgi:hypothetical protein